jgi:hypothetical protein
MNATVGHGIFPMWDDSNTLVAVVLLTYWSKATGFRLLSTGHLAKQRIEFRSGIGNDNARLECVTTKRTVLCKMVSS